MQLATHLAVWCSITGATVLGAIGLVERTTPVEPEQIPAPALAIDEVIEPSLAVAFRAADDPTPAPLLRYAFVIDAADGTYVKLASSPDHVRHGKPRLGRRNYETAAIADVAPADVPDDVARLAGRTVAIEGCTATITGFAIVARLTGSPGYAGIEDAHDEWTARTAFAKGQQQLVARLSSECRATPEDHDRWARDAALPAAVVGTEVPLEAATQAAVKRDLLASPLAAAADTQWNDPSWGEPAPGELPWREVVEVKQQAFVHGTTGQRWIVIHAFHGGSCGEKSVHLAAIYRERTPGTRVRVWSGDGVDVARLVDIDGDGAFEVLTRGGFGDETATLETLDGAAVDTLALPYFGCPC